MAPRTIFPQTIKTSPQHTLLLGAVYNALDIFLRKKGILTEEDINSFSESTLNFWVEQYENQKENIEQNAIKTPLNGNNQYSEETPEEKGSIETLLDFVNQL